MAEEIGVAWYRDAQWMGVLSPGDRAAFLTDFQEALRETTPENLGPLQTVLGEWCVTAAHLTNPEVAAALLPIEPSEGIFNEADFVEVPRPE